MNLVSIPFKHYISFFVVVHKNHDEVPIWKSPLVYLWTLKLERGSKNYWSDCPMETNGRCLWFKKLTRKKT